MSRLRYFALVALAMACALPAYAQTPGANPLTLDVSPQNPAPYETVTVTPQSSTVDLSSSAVTVSVNGAVVSKGSGGAGTMVTMGGPGTSTTIDVSISGPDGSYDTSVTLRPQSLALVVEPISTTHPFYEGGALVAPLGRVRLVAMPDFRTSPSASVSPDSLVYTWKLGDQILESSSGIGKSTLLLEAPVQYRDAVISLTVTSGDGSLIAQASTDISPTAPEMLIYKDGPLLGPEFDEVASNPFTMDGDEDSFRAVPYFFATAPTLSWSVNGAVSGGDQVVTVRTTGEAAGTAVLSGTATSADGTESADDSRTIRFGASAQSSSIFGL